MEAAQQVGDPLQAVQQGIKSMKLLIKKQPEQPRHYLQATRAYDPLAHLQFRAAELDAWEETLRAANQNMEHVVEQFGPDLRLVQFLTFSKNRLVHCIKARGHAEEAAQLFQQALAYRQSTLDSDPNNRRAIREVASGRRNLAWVYALFAEPLDLDFALENALQTVELDDHRPECWTALASIYYCKDDAQKMQQALESCSPDNSTDEMARLSSLVLQAWKEERSVLALDLLQQARQLHGSEEVQTDFLAR